MKKISPLPGVSNLSKHQPSEGSPLAPGSFPWRKNGKNADDLCDGIGLGMLSKNSPSKRRILKEDIPDNKAFFSCARGCAKSHLKWAEAFWLLLRSKSNKENAQALEIITRNYFTIRLNSSEPFGGALRVTHKGERKIFHPRCGLSVLLFTFLQIFHPFQGFNTNIHPSAGSPLAPGSFPVAEKWIECR